MIFCFVLDLDLLVTCVFELHYKFYVTQALEGMLCIHTLVQQLKMQKGDGMIQRGRMATPSWSLQTSCSSPARQHLL